MAQMGLSRMTFQKLLSYIQLFKQSSIWWEDMARFRIDNILYPMSALILIIILHNIEFFFQNIRIPLMKFIILYTRTKRLILLLV